MRLKTLNGNFVSRNYSRYLIKWDAKERSIFQTEVKNYLRPFLQHHLVYSEFPVAGTQMKIDIFDATTKTAFEIQGRQHLEYVKFFARNRAGYIKAINRDVNKEKFCILNSIKLVEIFESDLPLTYDFFVEKYDLHL